MRALTVGAEQTNRQGDEHGLLHVLAGCGRCGLLGSHGEGAGSCIAMGCKEGGRGHAWVSGMGWGRAGWQGQGACRSKGYEYGQGQGETGARADRAAAQDGA